MDLRRSKNKVPIKRLWGLVNRQVAYVPPPALGASHIKNAPYFKFCQQRNIRRLVALSAEQTTCKMTSADDGTHSLSGCTPKRMV